MLTEFHHVPRLLKRQKDEDENLYHDIYVLRRSLYVL